MKAAITVIIMSMISVMGWSQGSFKVELSQDSVLFGNMIEVTFVVENIVGEFQSPEFSQFRQIGGASHSTSISIINGEMSQSAQYTYRLEPLSEGLLIIDSALLHTEDDVLVTDPIDVWVMPNPDGIIERPVPRTPFNTPRQEKPTTPKTKRPITKL